MKLKNLLLTLFAALLFAACSSDKLAIETMDADAFELKLQQTSAPQLVDARTADEFSEFHIAGAKNIDVNSEKFEQLISVLDKGKPVFVYCKGGVRSLKAAGILETQGYKPIYNLSGGITEWIEKGKPTIR